MTCFSGFCKVNIKVAWLSQVLEDTEDDVVEVMSTWFVLCWWKAGLCEILRWLYPRSYLCSARFTSTYHLDFQATLVLKLGMRYLDGGTLKVMLLFT